MDLHNNELGRKIAVKFVGQGYDVFSREILAAIERGEGKALKWDFFTN